ncbi:MAG: sugar phosphate isomerase/epimerase [Proteobacteria bacterium]|nr:sugar phosphate isomerase/epimerase [Pseudomonadota bacterium]
MPLLINHVQVNIPFAMLCDSYLNRFIKQRLNPEIGLDAAVLERYSLSDFTDIAKEFHNHSLTITLHAPFIDLSPGSPDKSIRAVTRHRFEQVLQLVPIFKPETVVCHVGYDRERYSFIKDIWFENSLKMWSWLGTRIGNEGSLLMLENVYEDNPEDIKTLFNNLKNQNAGFCFDIGHQAVFSSVPLVNWLEFLGSYLGQLHMHDNCGKEDEHLAMGQGSINFQPLFDYLKSRRKNPPVITLEPHREEDLRPSLKYLEKFWTW